MMPRFCVFFILFLALIFFYTRLFVPNDQTSRWAAVIFGILAFALGRFFKAPHNSATPPDHP
jgi:hypothetical protein